jgi:hypothetical protein
LEAQNERDVNLKMAIRTVGTGDEQIFEMVDAFKQAGNQSKYYRMNLV